MTIQQIKIHGQDTHMPNGGDALPWLGPYPRTTNDVTKQGQGIHMVGALADRPAASLGTQTGSDGEVNSSPYSSNRTFSSASGIFSSVYLNQTIFISDPTDLTTSSYMVAAVSSSTVLELSSSYSGATLGSTTLSWVLSGPPSNAGLTYYATDGTDTATGALYQSVGSAWIPIGSGGSSSGSWVYVGTATQTAGQTDEYGNSIPTLIAANPGSLVVPFQNSWNNSLGSDAPVSFFLDGTMVALRGAAGGGTTGTVMFTLPTGYRPLYQQALLVPAASDAHYATCLVGADGTVLYEQTN